MRIYFAAAGLMILFAMLAYAQYNEKHRPQLHFSPPAMWMNDPNGMVYLDGEYHLFYQHYPKDIVWGPMHWGHAVSTDLVHWKHLPIAIAPDKLGYIFSGSAVADKNNSAGFKTSVNTPLIAMFTYHDPEGEKEGRSDFQYQGIAFSNDDGRTWKKYDKNPVIPNVEKLKDFRDPKVIWHEQSRRWIVTLAVGDQVRFYESPDMKNWTPAGSFGKNAGTHAGVWECPDLFPLKVEGTNQTKWVLLVSINPGGPNVGSATQYFVGDFDGKTFRSDDPPETVRWLDYGRDDYAGVTWSNTPNNRRIFLGWMSNWDYAQQVPTSTWRSAMTLPRDLSLRKTANGIKLFQNFSKEVERLRNNEFFAIKNKKAIGPLTLGQTDQPMVELLIEIDTLGSKTGEFGIEANNKLAEKLTIGYDIVAKRFFTDRTNAGKSDFSPKFANGRDFAPRSIDQPVIKLRLIFDAASVELIADDGATAMTDIFFPSEPLTRFNFFTSNGQTKIISARGWKLSSIWH